jgi:hypothetical protein
MTKTVVVESVSYKNRKIKVGNAWIPVSPFLTLDGIGFNQRYEVEVELDKSGQWYVTELKSAEVTEVENVNPIR